MKWKPSVVFGIAMMTSAFVMSGCSIRSDGGETSAAQKLSDSFTVEMTMVIDDLQGTGTVTRYGEAAWRVQFAEPSSLAGVVLDFSGTDVSASYQGLAFSVPQTAIPAKSVLLNLIFVVDALAQQEKIVGEADGDQVRVEGEREGNPYVLTLTQEGELAGFEMDNMDTVLTFTQFQSGAVAVATETTVVAS